MNRERSPIPAGPSPVTGPRLVGIGDSVVDIFRDRATAYPGGNALNVAVYWRMLTGAPADFIGLAGDDHFSDHVLATLSEIGVGSVRVRRAHGEIGRTLVDVTPDGDRIFVASNLGGVMRDLSLCLAREDLDLLTGAAVIHTSIYSGLDHRLGALAALAPVSYDFSDDYVVATALPLMRHLEVAFFSGSTLTVGDRAALARRCLEAGARAVVITAGAEGSIGYTAHEERHHGIERVDGMVDAMGAGDGFIAGFLRAWVEAPDLSRALAEGARTGAEACRLAGAFGRGIPATAAEMDVMIRKHPLTAHP